MTDLANDDFANRELSTRELEAVTAGGHLMSGLPNSMTLRLENLPPPPPRYWMGGSVMAAALRAF